MAREDVHRPSAMDPADYEWIGEADSHEGDGYFDFDFEKYADLTGHAVEGEDPDAIRWAEVEHYTREFAPDGGRLTFTTTGGCDHCGTRGIRYWIFFLHKPSGEVVQVGSRCAGVLGLDSREEKAKRAEHERRRMVARGVEWRAETPANDEAIEFLLAQLEDETGPGSPFYVDTADGRTLHTIRDEFYGSVLRRFLRHGELTEKQVAAVLRSKQRAGEREAEREEQTKDDPEPAPVVEGRITIRGRLLTIKTQDSMYGSTLKMLVLDDRGFKVWGTMPDALMGEDAAYGAAVAAGYSDTKSALRAGVVIRVEFVAAVERSNDDETFGFYKRPTKARVIA